MNNDLVSLIVENKNEIVKLQRVVGGKAPMTTNLDMGGYGILNVAHPRDPSKKEYESDLEAPADMIICSKLIKITWEGIEMVHLMED